MTGQGPSRTPSAAEIEALARAAIARLPEQFRAHLDTVVVSVEDYADQEALDALGIRDPRTLSGLYHGRPFGQKSSMDTGALPDRIHLYRQPILAEWRATGVDLTALVEHVLVHEVGHHFGLSDDDMHALEDDAE